MVELANDFKRHRSPSSSPEPMYRRISPKPIWVPQEQRVFPSTLTSAYILPESGAALSISVQKPLPSRHPPQTPASIAPRLATPSAASSSPWQPIDLATRRLPVTSSSYHPFNLYVPATQKPPTPPMRVSETPASLMQDQIQQEESSDLPCTIVLKVMSNAPLENECYEEGKRELVFQTRLK